MAILRNDAVYKFSIDGICKGQSIQNVLYYTAFDTTPPYTADEEAALAALITRWQTSVLPLLASAYSVVRYRLDTIIGRTPTVMENGKQLYKDEKSAILESAGGAADVGGKAGAIAPTFDAIGVRKRTSVPGKSFRGSMRLGPLVVADVNEQELLAASLTAAQTAMNTFKGLVSLNVEESLVLVIFGRADFWSKPAGVTDPTGSCAPVLDLQVKKLLTSQVSRKETKTFGA